MVKTPKPGRVAASHSTGEDLTMADTLSVVRRAIEDKKGEEIVVLDLTDEVDYLDYLVIANGTTEIHNRALADAVVEQLSSYAIISDGLSGYSHGDWILIDYGPLVVHIFTPGQREYYQLDDLWAGGVRLEV